MLRTRDNKSSYPIPDIQPHKWNQQEYRGPRILTSDSEDADHCDVHGNGHAHNKGEKEVNIRLIS